MTLPKSFDPNVRRTHYGRVKAPMSVKLNKYSIDPSTGCWLWMGGKLPGGYGQVSNGLRNIGAHRASYELHVGPIPPGKFVCHHCDNRACINPDHLFVADQTGNMSDAMRKGRSNAARLKARTHCKNGHLFTEKNTRRHKNGVARYCKACDLISTRIRFGWSRERAESAPNHWADKC